MKFTIPKGFPGQDAKIKEEKINTLTHGAGLLFALLFLPIIIGYSKDQEISIFVGVLIYSFCFLSLFLASTIYHATVHPRKKYLLQKLDHIAIFFMIAGSYTPFVIKGLGGQSQWIFLISVWLIVLFGTLYKIFFFGKYERLSVLIYLVMGWLLIFQIRAFWENLPIESILLIVIGGIAYTSGIYFYNRDHKKYYHSIWHLFSLSGSIFHFGAVCWIL